MARTAVELLTANLHGVFGERDPGRRRAAADATYTADVRFVDPEETVVGVDALEAKAAALLEGAPGFVFAEAGPAYVAATTPRWPGPSGRRTVNRSRGAST